MKVTVRFYGLLRRQVNHQRDLEVELPPGTTLAQLLNVLEARLGPEIGAQLRPFQGGHFAMLIVVNGQDHYFTGGMQAPLPEGALVEFMFPLAGGGPFLPRQDAS